MELNDGVLAVGHPVWIVAGKFLPLSWLQTNLNVSLESPEAAQWRRPKTSQCSIKAHCVLPVPVPSELPVVEIAFKQHQVCLLQGGIQVRGIRCHVTELMGLCPERMVAIAPPAIFQIPLPLNPTLGAPLVIGRHSLPDGPLKIFSCDIRDKPRDGFAVKMDLTCKARGNQEVSENQVSDQLEARIV